MEIIFSRNFHSRFSTKVTTQLTRSAAPIPTFEDRRKERRFGSTSAFAEAASRRQAEPLSLDLRVDTPINFP